MLTSMTGFGRAEAKTDRGRFTVEVRSVNHRFLEISPRLPRPLSLLEPKVVEFVQQKVSRGKITVGVSMEGEGAGAVAVTFDRDLAARYLELARELREQHGVDGDLDVRTLLTLPQVLVREDQTLSEEEAWADLAPTLEKALEAFGGMRRREGEALARDLLERVGTIREAVDRVQACVPKVVEAVRVRLRDRLAEISEDAEYNRNRLEVELALFADRADITEECVRLRSHCDQFEEFVGDSQPAGRRLKFLLEEMHREVNTIGSKGQDTEISRDVLAMKEEVERIREQVLNIE